MNKLSSTIGLNILTCASVDQFLTSPWFHWVNFKIVRDPILCVCCTGNQTKISYTLKRFRHRNSDRRTEI